MCGPAHKGHSPPAAVAGLTPGLYDPLLRVSPVLSLPCLLSLSHCGIKATSATEIKNKTKKKYMCYSYSDFLTAADLLFDCATTATQTLPTNLLH